MPVARAFMILGPVVLLSTGAGTLNRKPSNVNGAGTRGWCAHQPPAAPAYGELLLLQLWFPATTGLV